MPPMSEAIPTWDEVERARQLANKMASDRMLRQGSDCETLSYFIAEMRESHVPTAHAYEMVCAALKRRTDKLDETRQALELWAGMWHVIQPLLGELEEDFEE